MAPPYLSSAKSSSYLRMSPSGRRTWAGARRRGRARTPESVHEVGDGETDPLLEDQITLPVAEDGLTVAVHEDFSRRRWSTAHSSRKLSMKGWKRGRDPSRPASRRIVRGHDKLLAADGRPGDIRAEAKVVVAGTVCGIEDRQEGCRWKTRLWA